MLRHLTTWLKQRRARRFHLPVVRTFPMPLDCDSHEIARNMAAIERLEHLYTLGHLYREQMEAAADECVYLLGIDPETNTDEADIAREIVLMGADVQEAIQRIHAVRSLAGESL